MGPINLGPEWFWRFMVFLSVCGAVALLMLLIRVVAWAVNHIRIV